MKEKDAYHKIRICGRDILNLIPLTALPDRKPQHIPG